MDRYYVGFGLFQGLKTIKTARSYSDNGAMQILTPEVARFYEEYLVWHHSGTASLCAFVAAKMGLSTQKTQTALQGALVHDIGKMFIPEDILMRAPGHSREEAKIMKTHAEQGARFLITTGFSDEIVRAVRHHHERWDGTGYPDGLSGEKIPLLARIIGVCDAADAMAAGRHYKKKLHSEQIVEEIRAGAGGQFDPAMAKIMLEILQQNRRIEDVQNRA